MPCKYIQCLVPVFADQVARSFLFDNGMDSLV